MNIEEALEVCEQWFAYCENERLKTQDLQMLAEMAKQGVEKQKEAKRRLAQIDKAPVVYDGARLLPAVQLLHAEMKSRTRND